jgi:hypothetical protein
MKLQFLILRFKKFRFEALYFPSQLSNLLSLVDILLLGDILLQLVELLETNVHFFFVLSCEILSYLLELILKSRKLRFFNGNHWGNLSDLLLHSWLFFNFLHDNSLNLWSFLLNFFLWRLLLCLLVRRYIIHLKMINLSKLLTLINKAASSLLGINKIKGSPA